MNLLGKNLIKKFIVGALLSTTILTGTTATISNNFGLQPKITYAVDRIGVMDRNSSDYNEFEKKFFHSGDSSKNTEVQNLANALNKAISDPNSLNDGEKKYISFWASQPSTLNTELEGKIHKSQLRTTFNDKTKASELQNLLPNSIYHNLSKFNTNINNNIEGSTGLNISGAGGSQSLDGVGRHTHSDLIASVIFSRNKSEGRADSEHISLSELMRYPAASDQAQIYGRLESPTSSDGNTDVGGKTASYINTLYEYKYLVGVPKGSDNIFESIWQSVSDWGSAKVSYMSLASASWGASIFDFSISAIESLQSVINGFDPYSLLGFGSGTVSNWVNSLARGILDILDLSPSFFRVLAYGLWGMLIAFTVLGMMATVMAPRSNARFGLWTRFKRFLLRVIVAVSVIPVSGMITNIVDSLVVEVTNDYKIPNEVNERFIVDSLLHASTMNLSLSPISTSDFNSNGTKSEQFAPTPDNVQKLNRAIYATARRAGMLTDEEAKKSARELLNDFADNKTYTVNDYFARIKSSNSQLSNVIAASYYPTNSHFSLSGRFPKDYKTNGSEVMLTTPYFLTENKGVESSSDEATTREISYSPDGASGVQPQTYKLGPETKMSADSVFWNKPETYIYGAKSATSVTKSHADFSNFIGGPGSQQYKNPQTGENVSAPDNKEDAVGNPEYAVTRYNGNSIGIYNRYAGRAIYNGGLPSFSTQSTAFLLQSHLDTNTGVAGESQLEYAGYNTISTDESSSKNTGKNGNEMVRYVMPATDSSMWFSKVGILTALWVTAGVSGVLSFIYLLRAPLLSGLIRCISSLFMALATGNIISALSYLCTYTAIKLSFAFAKIGAYSGVIFVNLMMQLPVFGSTAGTILGADATFSVGGITNMVSGGNFALPSALVITFTILICVVLTWPVFVFRFGSSNSAKQARKVSILEALVNFPYLILVEAMQEYLDTFHRVIFGRSRSQTFGAKLKNQVEKVDQKAEFKKKAGQAAALGTALATGGLGAKMSMVKAPARFGNFVKSKLNKDGSPTNPDGSPGGGNSDIQEYGDGYNPLNAKENITIQENNQGGVVDGNQGIVGGTQGVHGRKYDKNGNLIINENLQQEATDNLDSIQNQTRSDIGTKATDLKTELDDKDLNVNMSDDEIKATLDNEKVEASLDEESKVSLDKDNSVLEDIADSTKLTAESSRDKLDLELDKDRSNIKDDPIQNSLNTEVKTDNVTVDQSKESKLENVNVDNANEVILDEHSKVKDAKYTEGKLKQTIVDANQKYVTDKRDEVQDKFNERSKIRTEKHTKVIEKADKRTAPVKDAINNYDTIINTLKGQHQQAILDGNESLANKIATQINMAQNGKDVATRKLNRMNIVNKVTETTHSSFTKTKEVIDKGTTIVEKEIAPMKDPVRLGGKMIADNIFGTNFAERDKLVTSRKGNNENSQSKPSENTGSKYDNDMLNELRKLNRNMERNTEQQRNLQDVMDNLSDY